MSRAILCRLFGHEFFWLDYDHQAHCRRCGEPDRAFFWRHRALEAARKGAQLKTYNDVCAAGVGGGEVCYRRRGHEGAHDPDSVEVYR